MAKRPTLADVLAAPDDLALRSVWADALQEAGDPRGEFAALQLATTKTYAGWVREAELLAEHGDAWAKPLGRYFASRVFEGGVLAGGHPTYEFSADPDDVKGNPGASFVEPEWKVITTIADLDERSKHVLDTKVPLQRLRDVWETQVLELLASKRVFPRIVELGIKPQGTGEPATKLLAASKAFPNLRILAIDGPRPHVEKVLAGSAVLKRIERLELSGIHDLYGGNTSENAEALLAAATASRGALREVVVRFSNRGDDLGWEVRLRRDKPGPFTEIIAWWRKAKYLRSPKELSGDCIRILNLVDRSKVRSLSIETGRAMRFPSDRMRVLGSQLAEMPLEHVVVPWQAPTLAPVDGGAQQWQLELTHCDALGQLAGAWQVFGADLGVAWDAMSADGRGTPKLGKDPLATLKQRAKSRPKRKLSLVRTGSTDLIDLTSHSWVDGEFSSRRAPPDLAAWFAAAVAALAPAGVASCGFVDRSDAYHGFDLETYGAANVGWIIALPPKVSKGLTPKHLAKLGAIPVACPDRTRVVFTIGDDPAKVDGKRALEVAAELVEILDEIRAAKAPAWFASAVRTHMAPIAKKQKLTKICDNPMRLAWQRGKATWVVRLDNTDGPWALAMEHFTATSPSGFLSSPIPIRSAAQAIAALDSRQRYF